MHGSSTCLAHSSHSQGQSAIPSVSFFYSNPSTHKPVMVMIFTQSDALHQGKRCIQINIKSCLYHSPFIFCKDRTSIGNSWVPSTIKTHIQTVFTSWTSSSLYLQCEIHIFQMVHVPLGDSQIAVPWSQKTGLRCAASKNSTFYFRETTTDVSFLATDHLPKKCKIFWKKIRFLLNLVSEFHPTPGHDCEGLAKTNYHNASAFESVCSHQILHFSGARTMIALAFPPKASWLIISGLIPETLRREDKWDRTIRRNMPKTVWKLLFWSLLIKSEKKITQHQGKKLQ